MQQYLFKKRTITFIAITIIICTLSFALIPCVRLKGNAAPTAANHDSINNFLAAKHYMAIPLRRNVIGHLVVKAVINSDTVELVLDTGASATCLEKESAKRLGIALNSVTGGASGYGGESTDVKMGKVQLAMGAFTLKSLDIAVVDLSYVNSAYSAQSMKHIDGILGADILVRYNAVIDYSSCTLFLK